MNDQPSTQDQSQGQDSQNQDSQNQDRTEAPENPVDSGRMPVRKDDQDRRPTGPMSPGTDAPDVDDGRPKGPMSPPHQRD